MVGTTATKFRVDENEVDKVNKVKKVDASAPVENTKRAALGDLQNRGVVRPVAAKDAAQKDLNDAKLQNALRSTKARVDSYWKKAPVAAGINAGTTAAAGQRKVLTRSNSVRVGTGISAASSSVGVQKSSLDGATGQQTKPKTLVAKVVEKKVQKVKYVNKTKPQVPDEKLKLGADGEVSAPLRREDSNLSRKSLTKLKQAVAQANSTAATSKPLANRTNSTAALANIKKKPDQPIKAAAGSSSAAPIAAPPTAPSSLKIVSVQTHSSQLLSAVEDIDVDDHNKLVLVSEYVNDIYNYLFSLEVVHAIHVNHLEGQQEVFPKMRAVLVDWINEVHHQFHLAPETFQMAVAIIDLYLQRVKDTKRSQLQLVGVTALFIAAKYEELYPPAIVDFVYITDDTYNAKQILQMELRIFRALDCNLSRPLPIHFLRRFSKAAKAEDGHHAMSKYFLELSSIEYELASYKPSEIAAASLFLALQLLGDPNGGKPTTGFNNALWTPTLEWYSRYSSEHLRPITKKIATIARNAPSAKLQAVYTKYQSAKLHKISLNEALYGSVMDSIINSKE